MKISQAESLALSLSTMLDTKGVVGYKIARNLRMINEELRDYYEQKQKLFEKYGTEKDGQMVIERDTDEFKKFMEEFSPVMDQEVNFDFRKITEEELIDSGLSAKQMALIWEMVDAN